MRRDAIRRLIRSAPWSVLVVGGVIAMLAAAGIWFRRATSISAHGASREDDRATREAGTDCATSAAPVEPSPQAGSAGGEVLVSEPAPAPAVEVAPRSRATSPWCWVRFGCGLLASSVLASIVFLAFFALLPALWGWQPVVVLSDSMRPGIASGDVVVTSPPSTELLATGVIARFDSPMRERTLLHRIVEIRDDGTLLTKGDANDVADSTPVAPHDLRGVARLVVPYVGYPVMLPVQGRGMHLALASVPMALLLWASRWGIQARFEPWMDARDVAIPPRMERWWRRFMGRRPPRVGRVAALAALSVIVGAGVSLVTTSVATFAASTASVGSSIRAGANFHVGFDGASSTSGDRVSNLTWSHTIVNGYANRLLVVGVSTDAGHPATGVTYGGSGLTFLGGITDGGNKTRAELWYLVAPAPGTANVVVSFASQTNDDVVAGATSWRAVHQSTPFGSAVFRVGNSTMASAAVSSAVGEVVVDVVSVDSKSVAVGPGQVQHWNAFLKKVGAGGSSEAGATSVTMSWPLGGTAHWAMATVPLKPANP